MIPDDHRFEAENKALRGDTKRTHCGEHNISVEGGVLLRTPDDGTLSRGFLHMSRRVGSGDLAFTQSGKPSVLVQQYCRTRAANVSHNTSLES